MFCQQQYWINFCTHFQWKNPALTPANSVANQFIIILYKPWKLESCEQKVRLILLSHYKHRCSANTMRNKQLKETCFFPPLAALAPWPIRKLFNICNLHLQKTIFTVTLQSQTPPQNPSAPAISSCKPGRIWLCLFHHSPARLPGPASAAGRHFLFVFSDILCKPRAWLVTETFICQQLLPQRNPEQN